MENRVWGDRIKEYEKSNTLNLLEIIEDLKIKNNELEAALAYEKLITENLNDLQNMTCEELGRYVVANHELKNDCENYELKLKMRDRQYDRLLEWARTQQPKQSTLTIYLCEKVQETDFYKNSKNDPSASLDWEEM